MEAAVEVNVSSNVILDEMKNKPETIAEPQPMSIANDAAVFKASATTTIAMNGSGGAGAHESSADTPSVETNDKEW